MFFVAKNDKDQLPFDTITPLGQLMIAPRIFKYKRLFFSEYDYLIRRENTSPAGIF